MVDAETDGENVLISLRKAQQLFDYEGAATSLFVKLSDDSSPEKGKMVLAEVLGDGFEIRSRDELNATLNRLMKYEKWGIFFIALMVLIIASFSIVGALVMLIIDKERDIATLRAMGADTSLLRKIFTAEGVLICTIGGVVGLMFGMALTLVQQHIGSEPSGAEILIDGKWVGNTPYAGDNRLDKGAHDVVLRLDGFHDAPLQIQGGESSRLSVTLRRK